MVVHEVREAGHEVVTLVSVISEREDSYMFHVPAIDLTRWQGEAMGIERRLIRTRGEKEREVDDLVVGLEGLRADALAAGAVCSRYQKERLEWAARRSGMRLLAPLWGREPWPLLEREAVMFDMIVVGCSADGLTRDWLGRRFTPEAVEDLRRVHAKTGIHPLGEGGEFETAVLDAPMFRSRLVVEYDTLWERDSGYIRVKSVHLRPKAPTR